MIHCRYWYGCDSDGTSGNSKMRGAANCQRGQATQRLTLKLKAVFIGKILISCKNSNFSFPCGTGLNNRIDWKDVEWELRTNYWEKVCFLLQIECFLSQGPRWSPSSTVKVPLCGSEANYPQHFSGGRSAIGLQVGAATCKPIADRFRIRKTLWIMGLIIALSQQSNDESGFTRR